MNRLLRACAVVAPSLALASWFTPPAPAQLIAAFVLAMGSPTPAAAQRDPTAALEAKVVELTHSGKYLEAIPLAQRVVAITEAARGPDHPDVARVLNRLALLYQIQGRYADVEPIYKRSLAIREKALGPRPSRCCVVAVLSGFALRAARSLHRRRAALQAIAGDP